MAMMKAAVNKNHYLILPFIVAVLVALPMITGCGAKGPRRYAVAGTITFRGQPVPFGYISFEPNSSKANKGPASGATIENGHFQLDSSKGVLGGHYIIAVDGKDGIPATIDGEYSKTGNFLFPSYKTEKEFPNEDTEWNIEIPGM
jgi:hypothetical protein